MGLRLSAVIPTHDRPQLLSRAIASIDAQTEPVFEIIVVDEASDPPVVLDHPLVSIVRHDKAKGPGAARNAGGRVARGDIIAFLDDDDIWMPEKVARVLSAFDEFPEAAAVFHRVGFSAPEEQGSTEPTKVENGVVRMLSARPPHTSGLAVRHEVHASVEYDESMAAAEDLEYHIRLALAGTIVEIDDVLALHGTRLGYPTAISLQQRIEGRQLLRDRYSEYFTDPVLERHHQLRLAHLHRRAGNRVEAGKKFAALAASKPSDTKAWKGLATTLVPNAEAFGRRSYAGVRSIAPKAVDGSERPKVSIGLPVLNGEGFLEETIESILSQTFTDFELIVVDNGSTDNTFDIAQSAAKKDQRVVVHRRHVTVGAHYNYNDIVPLARGEYFKWAAHDDIIRPQFLERCVAVLDQRPEVVLAHTWIGIIDETGQRVRERRSSYDYEDPSPSVRLRKYIGDRNRSEPTFGLHRMSALAETPLLGHFPGSDWILLAELALRGHFYEIDEELFLNRDHADRSTKAVVDSRMRSGWFEPGRTRPIAHHWHQLMGYVRATFRVPMPLEERLKCLLIIGRWGVRHIGDLAMDIWVSAKWALTSSKPQ